MRGTWLARSARYLELPVEAFGAARLIVVGRESLEIENHRGLLAFSPTEVVVRSEQGRITVTGRGLTLDLLWPDRLRVTGVIEAVQLQG